MTSHPENLTNRLGDRASISPAADLLSHVLANLSLSGDKMSARTFPANRVIPLKPEMAHVVVVKEGSLAVKAGGVQTAKLRAGELFLLPRGAKKMHLATTDSPTTVIDCSFWFDPDSRHGTALALPSQIHIQRDDCAPWIEPIVGFMMQEAAASEAGAALMVSRLIDLVVIRTLRRWVHQGHASGWLGGLVDARIARAINAIHENPRERWSIDALADVAGMSRSSFYDRFTSLVGQPPQRYSTEWRLSLAQELLGKINARVGQVGLSVGYKSEAAFSRAYKALYGHPPRAEAWKPGKGRFKQK